MNFLSGLRTRFILFCLAAVVAASATTGFFAHQVLNPQHTPEQPIKMTYRSEEAADFFMKKYSATAAYMTILKIDTKRNTRTPIYRVFNRDDVKSAVIERLRGGDGALPMFIRGDSTNNDNMLTVLEGTPVCAPFGDAGLARVWPDLVKRFTISCRVPIPPSPSVVRGYIVVHFDAPVRPYEQDTVKRDLTEVAKLIHEAN